MIPMIMSIASDEDKNYIEGLYEKYSKKMFAYIYKILANHEAAEDCVHDVVQRIINHIDFFKSVSEDDTIRLIMIYCRNEAFNYYRNDKLKNSREKMASDDFDESLIEEIEDDTYNPEKVIISEENNRYLFELVNKLDYKYKDVMILKYYFNLSNIEIANQLDVTPGVVAIRISRAKKKLLEMGGSRLYD